MSDQYQQYAEYENAQDNDGYSGYADEDMQQQDENYETQVQLDYFEAEQLLRKNQIVECIDKLQQNYVISVDKQLKSWKVKILNFLLQIYCRAIDINKIKQTLERISELNKKEKYTQNAVRSIIMTIKSLPSEAFNLNKNFVYGFIEQLDNLGKIRSYLLFLEKAVDEDDIKQAETLFEIIRNLLSETSDVSPGNLIQLFSFQIRHSRKTHRDITKQVRKMQLKLQALEAQSYMSQGHISIIKQAVAQKLFTEDNYKDCAAYLSQTFQDNMKYGKSTQIKKTLLKTNVLVGLLTEDKEVYMNDKFNALYHESASSFKGENDIQLLYGMVQAFMDCDLNLFIQQSRNAQLTFKAPYQNLLLKVISRLKMIKLLQIIKPYTNIKSSYLSRRLNSSRYQIEQMLFTLITDNKIEGRIRKQEKQTYLDIDQVKDEFLTIQLSNIKQISKRYL